MCTCVTCSCDRYGQVLYSLVAIPLCFSAMGRLSEQILGVLSAHCTGKRGEEDLASKVTAGPLRNTL